MDYLERSASCYKYSAASDSWLEYVNSIGDHSLITSAFLVSPFLSNEHPYAGFCLNPFSIQ